MSNPVIDALDVAWVDFKNWVEAQAKTDFAFLMSFFKEAISEEEAALFPQFKTQAIQIFNDAVMTSGFTVEQRVELVITEALKDLAADVVIARTALYNSWAWAIAKQQGLTNGNQGSSATGDFSGGADSAPATPAS